MNVLCPPSIFPSKFPQLNIIKKIRFDQVLENVVFLAIVKLGYSMKLIIPLNNMYIGYGFVYFSAPHNNTMYEFYFFDVFASFIIAYWTVTIRLLYVSL